jgi:hypothetical protein
VGTSWRDDGTLPRPDGPREAVDIVKGADELRGRVERLAFVAGLLESGEWEYHGAALVLLLATEWRLRPWQVRRFEQEALAALALNPQTRAALVGVLAAELDGLRRSAKRNGAFGPAVNAVMGKAKLFGLVGSDGGGKRPESPAAPEVPPWLVPDERKGEP